MKESLNLTDPDGFYAALIDAQEGLDAEAGAAFNARLVFLLANQVGEQDVLLECIAAARSSTNEAVTQKD